MHDLLVIGAGLSGLTAAYTAAQAGLAVRIVSKGLNALHWSAGTVDVLGYRPGAEDGAVTFPLEAIDALAEDNPDHPYVRLGKTRVGAALEAFQALTQEVGLPYKGAKTPGANLLLPSPAGAARPVYLAPVAQHAGDLSQPDPMLIVGFEGMRDFYPELIAENLRKQGYQARATFLPMATLTDRRDFNTVQLAHGLEKDDRLRPLARELKRLRQPGERIGLPAILGMDRHQHVLATLQTESGGTVFEIPTLPPSVPGIRLFQRLRDRLREMGVRLEAGMEVIDAEMATGAPGRVVWVATETSSRPLRHRAHHFLLATGGILGGGFNSDHTGRVWEVIFDLPLTTPQNRGEWFGPGFLTPDGHPVFSGGVAVDDRGRPVNGNGTLIYENLWAAGNLLAHVDPLQERSLEGMAIATGVAAAEAISHASEATAAGQPQRSN